MASEVLSDALAELTDALGHLEFGLLAADRDRTLAIRDRVRRDVEGHIARLRHPDAPLLVVVGGVTGGGKSTMVNTLAGAAVAATGVRRPTTSSPTLVCNPDDLGWFDDDRVLPGLERRLAPPAEPAPAGGWRRRRRAAAATPPTPSQEHDGTPAVHLVPVAAVPAGLALLDAPDSDSVSTRNRELADALLDAADVWVWVTTQGKYADEDSMALLRRARDRRTAIAVALTHVDPGDLQVVVDDFGDKLAVEGLPAARLFVVPRSPVRGDRLPEHALFDLRGWLWSLAEAQERDALREQTLRGALDALPAEVEGLLAKVDAEHQTYRSLTGVAAQRYGAATASFADMLEQGRISMREQVLRSWVDFVGTGRFQRFLQSATDRARQVGRRLLGPLVDKQGQRLGQDLRVEAADAVAARVGQVADLAAGDTAGEWMRDPAGRMLLDAEPALHRSRHDLADRVATAVAAWELELIELVTTKGEARKVRTQWASTAINATAASLMIVVFTATGGLTGAEVGIAGAGATLGQLVLEKMLGSQNVRWLVAEAKVRLLAHVEAILAEERARFTRVAAERAPDPVDRDRIVAALDRVRASR
jgi:energy-coupling factor transporter ATP-binding protein EcfA2